MRLPRHVSPLHPQTKMREIPKFMDAGQQILTCEHHSLCDEFLLKPRKHTRLNRWEPAL